VRPERQLMVKEMKEKLKNTDFFFVTDFQGLKVSDMSQLRKKLKEKESVYQVFKNRLFKRIIEEEGLPKEMENDLRGFSGFVIGGKDVIEVAKVLSEFAKEHETFIIKAGVIDKKYLKQEEVKSIANLPSREVLLAKVVGAIAAPITGFVTVLNERIASFVRVVNAIAEKKQNEQ